MSFATPWGLLAAAAAAVVVLVHVLRPRRAGSTVSSLFLWRAVERPVSAAQPWQRLRWSSLLLAQLLAVALLAVALARPVRLEPARLAAHTVFIIDASASMGALDGAPDRIGAAVERAQELRAELPDGGRASIVLAGARPRVLLTSSPDTESFADALRTIDVSEGSADFAGAFALAESLETGAEEIGFVLLSDGGLTEADQRQQPPGTRYEPIGSGDINRAVARLSVEPRGSGLHVRTTLRHEGGPPATQTVRIDVDGVTAHRQEVELSAGRAVELEVDVPLGDRVEAFLEGGDLLALDDRAVAVAGRRPPIEVLLAGDTAYVGELLASIPGVTVTVADEPSPTGEGYDLVVYNEVALPAAPAVPYWAIAPPGGAPGVAVTGEVDQPAIALVRSEDPLLSGIDLTEVGVAAAQRIDAPDAEVLVGAEGAPLLVHGTTGALPWAYLAFPLAQSNLPVQLAFPLLGDRLLTELAGTARAATSLEVGAALPLPAGVDAVVVDPVGDERTVAAGAAVPVADRAGFWRVREPGGAERLVAVNPPSAESSLAPADELVKPFVDPATVAEPARAERSLAGWVILALLVVLAAEWFLARRARGVGRRQWRAAMALRLAIAGALLAALLAPVVDRPAQRAAVVFLLDASDSVGAAGLAESLAWARDALDGRARDDVAGVVVFGAEARLEQLVQASSELGVPRVVIDPAATDLEAAVRLGAALVPDDARRRLVLLSDGRATTGDAEAEAEELGRRGIPIDVHLVGSSATADAAIERVEVPRVLRAGEAATLEATVVATEAGPGEVVLRRDGTEVARQQVELVAGENEVTFRDVPVAEPGAVVRYSVAVEQAGDEQPANDLSFAAVPVEGPARVLVVEGTPDEGASLAQALEAAGLVADTVDPGALPDVQELAGYEGIVLVNVDARTFTGAQLQALETAVRDLGRGLVTVGGERSYGLGGYRGTPLEDLLPVISEILDPLRRTTVAQVLSIDVSGSMANCHCDEGELAGARLDGGVNKTDISRAAALRTVEALSAEDELGILAWNTGSKWIVDLQQLPAAEVVEEGLSSLKPAGNTNLRDSLEEAALALATSRAGLKHIILFSDGFTDVRIIEEVAAEAGALYDEQGITVSVVATGEGAAPSLEDIAVQGHGRYYPGRDLQRVPQVIAEEAVIASRDFVTEGEFLPEVTARTPVTERLAASPVLLGYVATTAKPAATTQLRIGPDRDPLLASWQAGLGRVTSWTSDAGPGWSQNWAAWDGFVGFWSDLVSDTFLAGDETGAAQASLSAGRLTVTVDAAAPFPDGATAVARVAGPDGQRFEVPLERIDGDSFAAELPASRSGSYAVGVEVEAGGDTVLASTTLASESYPAEYEPGAPDGTALVRLSTLSGGRGAVDPAAVFDRDGLEPGVRRFDLRGPLLLFAALAWPLAVVLSRLALRGFTLADARGGPARLGASLRSLLRRLTPADPGHHPAPPRPEPPAAGPARPPSPPTRQTETVSALLERKRARRDGPAAGDDPDRAP